MYSYLIPSITSLPVGYQCRITVPRTTVCSRLHHASGRVRRVISVFHQGEARHSVEEEVEFVDGEPLDDGLAPFTWSHVEGSARDEPAFIEASYYTADDRPGFASNAPINPYATLSAPGKKSFFTDNAQKFSSPPIIAQIAEFGQYVETYPVIRLDRARDYGESIIMINPYKKAIVAKITSHDRRVIPRIRVAPANARRVDLTGLLRDGEERWRGRIQITANNRLILFNVKHSMADPTTISDHEHLDPFRADPTHMPLTLRLRKDAGALVTRVRKALGASQ